MTEKYFFLLLWKTKHPKSRDMMALFAASAAPLHFLVCDYLGYS